MKPDTEQNPGLTPEEIERIKLHHDTVTKLKETLVRLEEPKNDPALWRKTFPDWQGARELTRDLLLELLPKIIATAEENVRLKGTLEKERALLQDPAAIHLNMMRGTIAWTESNLKSILGIGGWEEKMDRLEAENERLREALKHIADETAMLKCDGCGAVQPETDPHGFCAGGCGRIQTRMDWANATDVAQAALNPAGDGKGEGK